MFNGFPTVTPQQVRRAIEVRNRILLGVELGFEPVIQKYCSKLNPNELNAMKSITNDERLVLANIINKLKMTGQLDSVWKAMSELAKIGYLERLDEYENRVTEEKDKIEQKLNEIKTKTELNEQQKDAMINQFIQNVLSSVSSASSGIGVSAVGDGGNKEIKFDKIVPGQISPAGLSGQLTNRGLQADMAILPPNQWGSLSRIDFKTDEIIRKIIAVAKKIGMENAITSYGRELKERDQQTLRSITQYELNMLDSINKKLTVISSLPIQLP